MKNSEQHEQAARLLALALKAREAGRLSEADELTARAAKYLDRATTFDTTTAPQAADAPQQVVQQQQQPQPEKDETKK
jgi:hypothetical protein